MKIPIYFLGTGSAIPTAKKNHTCLFLKYKQENILIDCGEGTQRQFRKAKLNPCKINRILITHWHGDHVLGLPGLLQTLALQNIAHEIKIYGPKGTRKYTKEIFKTFYFVGKLKIKIKEISKGKVFETPEFKITSERLKHSIPTLGYCFKEKNKTRLKKNKIKKLKLSGNQLSDLSKGKDIKYNGKKMKNEKFTYNQEGKKISFIFDTGYDKKIINFAKNSDLIVSEASFDSNMNKKAKEYKHLTAEQAGNIAKKSKSKRLILVHLSQRHEKNEGKLVSEARKKFKNTKIAKDLDKVEI